MMDEQVLKAGAVILNGGTILYPTDTIWGLGCDATNQDAIQKLYKIKQRPYKKSMLVLMNGLAMLSIHLEEIPESAREIIRNAQKPTTIIYQDGRNFPKYLLAEDGSIGIRITTDPFCRQLIELTGKPLVSTSANISGTPSATTFNEIEEAILDQVDSVVDWKQEETSPATPSAVIKLDSQGGITIIRA